MGRVHHPSRGGFLMKPKDFFLHGGGTLGNEEEEEQGQRQPSCVLSFILRA